MCLEIWDVPLSDTDGDNAEYGIVYRALNKTYGKISGYPQVQWGNFVGTPIDADGFADKYMVSPGAALQNIWAVLNPNGDISININLHPNTDFKAEFESVLGIAFRQVSGGAEFSASFEEQQIPPDSCAAVSYTHLTLPTILLV